MTEEKGLAQAEIGVGVVGFGLAGRDRSAIAMSAPRSRRLLWR